MPGRTPKRTSSVRARPTTAKTAADAAPPPAPATAPAIPASLPPPSPDSDAVVLRTIANGRPVELPLTRLHELFRLSRTWATLVSNRQRFTADSMKQLRDQSRAQLAALGVEPGFLKLMADAGVVEVSIPYVAEERGWERRTMPWESMLSYATKELRGERHLCVVRHLVRSGAPPPPAVSGPPEPALLFSSAPGRLGEVYSFENELRLVQSALQPGVAPGAFLCERNLLESELAQLVHTDRPALLHLTGLDAHQGATLLGLGRDETRHDGFYFNTPQREPAAVGVSRMAEIVTDRGTHAPRLVAYNCYFSGSRLAAMAVARGARAAIGFQDSVDDTAAERFFTVLYTHWRRENWSNLLGAFMAARNEIAAANRQLPSERQGGDVVLWTGHSFINEDPERHADAASLSRARAPVSPPARPAPVPVIAPVAAVAKDPVASPPPPAPKPTPAPAPAPGPVAGPAPAAPVAAADPASWIEVEVKPRQRLNYSLLHNDRSPFATFLVRKFNADLQPLLEIDIRLIAGDSVIPFLANRRLREMVTDLTSSDVRLPLVAGFFRQLRESVHTTLMVELKCDGRIIHRDSYRVTLLPADEWTDDDFDRQWLPSFVLPRDPVVQRVIEAAPRYLRALADDSGRGFDGYQRVAADGRDDDGAVDLQVRAIWSALLYETPLNYINPPPTYTPGAQRVRTPAQMFAGHHGTCLDLALLFAACLEYIGLMPVVFLIQGHAFPGYWRSEQAWGRWLRIGSCGETDDPAATDQSAAGNAPRLANRWVFGRDSFAEIVPLLNDGGLVPVETTELTKRGSYAGALDLGFRNLTTGWNFDALIDLQSARAANVTPLPLFDLSPNPADRAP